MARRAVRAGIGIVAGMAVASLMSAAGLAGTPAFKTATVTVSTAHEGVRGGMRPEEGGKFGARKVTLRPCHRGGPQTDQPDQQEREASRARHGYPPFHNHRIDVEVPAAAAPCRNRRFCLVRASWAGNMREVKPFTREWCPIVAAGRTRLITSAR